MLSKKDNKAILSFIVGFVSLVIGYIILNMVQSIPLVFFRNSPLGAWTTYASTPQYQLLRLVFSIIGLIIPIIVGMIIVRVYSKATWIIAVAVITIYTIINTSLFILSGGDTVIHNFPLMLSGSIYQAIETGVLIILGMFMGEKILQKK